MATVFGAIVATVYLVAFWSPFGINVIQFIGLSDIVKLALYPWLLGISGILGGWVGGMIFNELRLRREAAQSSPATPVRPDSPAAVWLNKNVTPGRLLALLFVICFGMLLFTREPYLWTLLSAIAAFLVGSRLSDAEVLNKYIPNRHLREISIFLPLLSLGLSFGIAKEDAFEIIQGKQTRRISTKTLKGYGSEEFKARGLLETDETLKFIGVAGDYFFFLREDNSATYAFKYDDLLFFETWK